VQQQTPGPPQPGIDVVAAIEMGVIDSGPSSPRWSGASRSTPASPPPGHP
jgi:hypothetical protein